MMVYMRIAAAGLVSFALAGQAMAAPVLTFFEGNADTPAGISPTRDAFRAAVGGGTVAGANGSFGGVRREINWDGVPDGRSDPNTLPGNFFNTTSPRGAVFQTAGSGFLVSASAGSGSPILFGFPSDFQTFSAQRLFTAIGSNVVDVSFFVPGTSTAATTTAFGLFFVDVELATSAQLEFFDAADRLIGTRAAPSGANQSLTFVGATVAGGVHRAGADHVRREHDCVGRGAGQPDRRRGGDGRLHLRRAAGGPVRAGAGEPGGVLRRVGDGVGAASGGVRPGYRLYWMSM